MNCVLLQVGVWSFVVGYVTQATVSLLSQGGNLFKRKGWLAVVAVIDDIYSTTRSCTFKDKLMKALLSKKNINFGAFLASLAAGFKVQPINPPQVCPSLTPNPTACQHLALLPPSPS